MRKSKTFDFGKIDYNRTGRKVYPVDVTMTLNYADNGEIEFTASGNIWNSHYTHTVAGGQCLDEINEFVTDSLFKKIYGFWKKYHLNAMHAGTPAQEEALEKWHKSKQAENRIVLFDYDTDCDYLESIDLYEDEFNGKPYKYGTAWLYYPIPADDLKDIERLLS